MVRRHAGWSADQCSEAFDAWFGWDSVMEDAERKTGFAVAVLASFNRIQDRSIKIQDVDQTALAVGWWFLSVCQAVGLVATGGLPPVSAVERTASDLARSPSYERLDDFAVLAGSVVTIQLPISFYEQAVDRPGGIAGRWLRQRARPGGSLSWRLRPEHVHRPSRFVHEFIDVLRWHGGRQRYGDEYVQAVCLARSWEGKPMARSDITRLC
jgi:hypothetical protein